MAEYLIKDTTLQNIANSIRTLKGYESGTPISVSDFSTEIDNIDIGFFPSISVTGLSENDIVYAEKDGKRIYGKQGTQTEYELVSLIPKMTSNTTPSGVVSYYSLSSKYQGYYAFDAEGAEVGNSYVTAYPYSAGKDYVQYQFASPVNISKIELWLINDRNWKYTFLISEDGATWNSICQLSNNPDLSTDWRWFSADLPEEITAKYLRCRIDLWTNLTGNPAQVGEIRAYGRESKNISSFTIPIKTYGTWTITATNNEKTITQDILVDTVTEYKIEMDLEI